MKTSNLPAGYRIEEIPGGCRQHFPGGYREYHRVGGGYMTHTAVTDGRTVSHEKLNQIFQGSHPFQDSKCWNDGFPFKLRSRIIELEQELATQKKVVKGMAALAAISLAGLLVKLF